MTTPQRQSYRAGLTPHYDLLQHVARAIADSQCNDVTMGEKYPDGMPKPYLRMAAAAIQACGIERLAIARNLLLQAHRAIADVRNNETAMTQLRPHEQAAVSRAYNELADFIFGAETTWFGGNWREK